MIRPRRRTLSAVLVLVVGLLAAVTVAVPAHADGTVPHEPGLDPFYSYDGPVPLASYAPGAVLKTRAGQAHVARIRTPIQMTQLLYRTVGGHGEPTQTVVSVLRPPVQNGPVRVVSYQSFYDSLTQRCQPSWVLNGGADNGGFVIEQVILAAYLAQGYTVVTSDFEGQDPLFANGPSAGRATLDALRAAYGSPATGIPASAKAVMVGYSGGAIGTEWAAEMAPTYAPDVNARLLGATMGGLIVDPIHNLHYVDGSRWWTGVMPMALLGISKAFDVDLSPYMSAYGLRVNEEIKDACILDANGHYPGLRFADLVKPEYAEPEDIPVLVELADQLIMGRSGTPTIPLQVRQGLGGPAEGTRHSATYGKGDGVMLAGDVRTLARQYCAAGVPVDYAETPLSHQAAGVTSLLEAMPWIADRFAGRSVPSTCGSIKPGNSIAPIGGRR